MRRRRWLSHEEISSRYSRRSHRLLLRAGLLGSVDNTQKWYTALGVLVCFSLFVQMAEGATYGIVPFVAKDQLAVWSALVGAGGNLGAVIAGWCFYKPIEDDLLPFKLHGLYVMFEASANVLLWWPEYGGMFTGLTIGRAKRMRLSQTRSAAMTSQLQLTFEGGSGPSLLRDLRIVMMPLALR